MDSATAVALDKEDARVKGVVKAIFDQKKYSGDTGMSKGIKSLIVSRSVTSIAVIVPLSKHISTANKNYYLNRTSFCHLVKNV